MSETQRNMYRKQNVNKLIISQEVATTVQVKKVGMDFKRGKTPLRKNFEEMGGRDRGRDDPSEESVRYDSWKQLGTC